MSDTYGSLLFFVIQCAVLLFIPIAFPALAYSQCAKLTPASCGGMALGITIWSFIIGAMFVVRVLDRRLSTFGCCVVGLANTVSIVLSTERGLTQLSQYDVHVAAWVKYIVTIVVGLVWHASYCFCMRGSAMAVGAGNQDWLPLTLLFLVPRWVRRVFSKPKVATDDIEFAVVYGCDEQNDPEDENTTTKTEDVTAAGVETDARAESTTS